MNINSSPAHVLVLAMTRLSIQGRTLHVRAYHNAPSHPLEAHELLLASGQNIYNALVYSPGLAPSCLVVNGLQLQLL